MRMIIEGYYCNIGSTDDLKSLFRKRDITRTCAYNIFIAKNNFIYRASPLKSATYKKAADLGYAPSMFNYAISVLSIAGGPNEEVVRWLQKAADKGYEPAKKRLKLIKVSQYGSLWDLIG